MTATAESCVVIMDVGKSIADDKMGVNAFEVWMRRYVYVLPAECDFSVIH